jgi:hypothetical protein
MATDRVDADANPSARLGARETAGVTADADRTRAPRRSAAILMRVTQ